MKRHNTLIWLASAGLVLLAAGCNSLVFNTETKFGLDISQSATQNPSITFGYERVAAASFPVAPTNKITDASLTNDSYSVLADFTIYFNPILSKTPTNGLRVNQFFATGFAARQMAASPDIAYFLGKRAGTNLATTNVSGK